MLGHQPVLARIKFYSPANGVSIGVIVKTHLCCRLVDGHPEFVQECCIIVRLGLVHRTVTGQGYAEGRFSSLSVIPDNVLGAGSQHHKH